MKRRLCPTSEEVTFKVACNKKGFYCDQLRHVRLAPETKLSQYEGYVQYSNSLGYHYLESYPALYHQECRNLLIFYNELPLSLAEAYKLLLDDKTEFINYTVFSHFNRNGYFCFKPAALVQLSERPTNQLALSSAIANLDDHDISTRPLFEIHTSQGSYEEVLDTLRQFGPQDFLAKEGGDDNLLITFDAYKRETFSQNKPRRGKLGSPTYFVIVCDKNIPGSPSAEQLDSFECKYGLSSRQKLLFAIVDTDSTISVAHFNPINPSDIEVAQNQWPETTRDRLKWGP